MGAGECMNAQVGNRDQPISANLVLPQLNRYACLRLVAAAQLS